MRRWWWILVVFIFNCERKSGPQLISIKEGVQEVIQVSAPNLNNPLVSHVETWVYLPPGYTNEGSPYPVIYLLHGFGGNHMFFQNVYDIKGILDYLISSGEIPPVVVVTPNASNSFGGTFYSDSRDERGIPVFETYERFFINDLIPQIEARYNVYRNRRYRGLVGLSMGGYGALKLILRNPHLFIASASHSGIVDFNSMVYEEPSLLTLVSVEHGGASFSFQRVVENPSRYPLSLFVLALSYVFSPKIDSIHNFNQALNEIPIIPLNMDSTIWAGIRLPFDSSWNILPQVFDSLWIRNHNLLTILGERANILRDSGCAFYVDVGAQDDYYLYRGVQDFITTLQRSQINYDRLNSGVYEYDGGYDPRELRPGHVTYFYLRFRRSLYYVLSRMGD